MKKNVLLIVIDSVTNDILFNESSSSSKAPFLNDLRKKSISGNKMYSEAPYTEAALKALLGSIDTMDNGGYIEKFKNTYLVTEAFKNAGYHVFSNAFYPNIYPRYSLKGIDTKRYFEGYNFSSLWEYRLKYYQNLYLTHKTDAKENKMLFYMFEDNLKSWILYLQKLKNNDVETALINECVDKKNIEEDILKLKYELDKFNKNKNEYFINLMNQGEKHLLFKINNYKYEDKINDDEYREYFVKKVKKTLKKVKITNFIYNFRNNKLPIHQLLFLLKNKDYNSLKGVLAGYKNSLFDKDLYNRCNYHFDLFKAQRSFKFMSRYFCNWLDENSKKCSPWFSYIHVDDAHYPESFLSYDIAEKENLNLEIRSILDYIKSLPKDYKGSLAYDLALKYCDEVIKNLFSFLDKKNILKDTMVVITADHGYSYSFCPPRSKYVLTNYNENYNVPYLIYNHKNIKMIDEFRTTKDIPATLLDLVNIKIPNMFKGHSLLKDYTVDHVYIEYMGGGCPDIIRRPINLGVRTEKYLVVMDVYLQKSFEASIIKEVYDLKNDKYEKYNIYDKIEKDKLKYEINLIYQRYKELRKEYCNDKNKRDSSGI